MIGRLPGSRSPPAPSTTISRPVGQRAQGGERRGDGVGLVGVVDDDGEVLAGVDPLEPAGDAAPAAMPGGDRAGVEPDLGAPGDRGQRVGDVEVAGQGHARRHRSTVGAQPR